MSSLSSRDSPIVEKPTSQSIAAALPADAFDAQTAKAGVKKFAALWPFMPPIALFGIAFAFIGAPLPTPIGNNASAVSTSIISASNWVVPASETMVVVKQSASGYAVLRGRLRAPKGELVSAPSRGQIARVMAKVGQFVKAGDPLLLISRGTIDAPRKTSPLENWSAQAEDAQIAAAKQQEALESRMRGANERLQTAQARVSDAQARVAAARALIKRVQNGEEVSRDDVKQPAKTLPAPTPTRSAEKTNRSGKARADAARESQQLQKNADAADAVAKAAGKEAKAADAEMGKVQSQLKAATAALGVAKSAPAKTAAPKTTPSKTPTADGAAESAAPPASTPDTTQETRAVSDARGALATATSRASQAHREASKAQARATELRANANDAARRALEALQVFENENEAPVATIAKADTEKNVKSVEGKKSGNKITIADAARIARQAMKESDEAIADADRISREVRGYERPVTGTMRRVDNATRRLESAQQQIWSAAGAAHPNITQVAASASGTLLSLSGVTSEISFGQTVAVIGRPDRLEVSIPDSSGMWKSLKVGSRILALVKTDAANASDSGATLSPAINSTDASTPALARPASATRRNTVGIPNSGVAITGTPTLARVVAIAPPVKAGAPATIRVAVHNPPQSGSANSNGTSPRAFTAGMGVLFSLPKPGKSVMIRVPAASIRRDENGKTLVAVLAPVPDSATAHMAAACRVEWREVRVGSGDGFNNQILAGLQPGERVALRPDTLYDFTLAYGAQATVRVEQT